MIQSSLLFKRTLRLLSLAFAFFGLNSLACFDILGRIGSRSTALCCRSTLSGHASRASEPQAMCMRELFKFWAMHFLLLC